MQSAACPPGRRVPVLARQTLTVALAFRPARRLACARPPRRRRRPTAAAAALPAAAAGGTAAAVAASAIGWLVVAGSTVRSLPQIVRIVRARSVEGLSLAAFASELVSYTVQVAYHVRHRFPLSTYGDTACCWLQDVVIIGLIFRFSPALGARAKAGLTAAFVAGCAALAAGAVGDAALRAALAASVALLGLGSRLPQIVLNARRGDSGELSAASTALSVAGNAARVFTTLVLVGDPWVLGSAASQLALNGVLLQQTLATAARRRVAAAAAAAAA